MATSTVPLFKKKCQALLVHAVKAYPEALTFFFFATEDEKSKKNLKSWHLLCFVYFPSFLLFLSFLHFFFVIELKNKKKKKKKTFPSTSLYLNLLFF